MLRTCITVTAAPIALSADLTDISRDIRARERVRHIRAAAVDDGVVVVVMLMVAPAAIRDLPPHPDGAERSTPLCSTTVSNSAPHRDKRRDSVGQHRGRLRRILRARAMSTHLLDLSKVQRSMVNRGRSLSYLRIISFFLVIGS